MSQRHIHILMTGGGAPGAPGIIRCLEREKTFSVLAADANPQAIGQHLATEFVSIPLATDPAFIDALLVICSERKIDIVMPLVTRELVKLSSHIASFESVGTKVLVSPAGSLEIANDKARLYQFLEWRGIPVPAFRVVENINQFREAVKDLGYPARTVCFKPSVSNGSRGFRVINEQVNELDLLFNHKPDSTYISMDEADRILSSGKFPELLVSEYLPGEEYSVDCLVNRGEPVIIVPRLRKKIINGISVEGEFIAEEKIIGYCSQIVKELKLHGNIGIQVKRSASGQLLVLEINPRVQGTIAAALGAGVNLPVLAVKQEMTWPILPAELKIKWGTCFSRYYNEVFY